MAAVRAAAVRVAAVRVEVREEWYGVEKIHGPWGTKAYQDVRANEIISTNGWKGAWQHPPDCDEGSSQGSGQRH